MKPPPTAAESDREARDRRDRKPAPSQTILGVRPASILRSKTSTPRRLKQSPDLLRLDLIRPGGARQINPSFNRGPIRPVNPCAAGTLSASGPRLWPFVFGVLVFGILLYCLRPTKNLRSDPPPELSAGQLHLGVDQSEWARAYWKCARSLRSKYTYGVALPQLPPPEFRIAQEDAIPKPAAEAVRLMYWRQLQKVWLSSAVETTYTVKSEWVSAAGRTLHELQSDIAKAGHASVP